MPVRGIRGAIDVSNDQPDEILSATRELLETILLANPSLKTPDVASVLFTVTEDIRSVFPAQAARQSGWGEVPLICGLEIPVPGSLPRCIRVLLHWNTELSQADVHHVYLRGAAALRPDLKPLPQE